MNASMNAVSRPEYTNVATRELFVIDPRGHLNVKVQTTTRELDMNEARCDEL